MKIKDIIKENSAIKKGYCAKFLYIKPYDKLIGYYYIERERYNIVKICGYFDEKDGCKVIYVNPILPE